MIVPSRVIRSEINESESLASVSPQAELTFHKLILAVDDYGRIDARPRFLRARLFGLRDDVTAADVERWVRELAAGDDPPLMLYEVNGKPYLWLTGWEKHRGNSRRARYSKCPQPPGCPGDLGPYRISADDSGSPGDSRTSGNIPELPGDSRGSARVSCVEESCVEESRSREKSSPPSPPLVPLCSSGGSGGDEIPAPGGAAAPAVIPEPRAPGEDPPDDDAPEDDDRDPPPKRRGKTAAPPELPPEDLERLRAWCAEKHPEHVPRLAELVEACLDHFRAKGERRADWVATCRTWVRNEQRMNGARASPRSRDRPQRPGRLEGFLYHDA
jgi:hypothetical protein